MQKMSIYRAGAITPAQEITADLFTEFVTWIDRGDATTRSYLTNLRQFAAWMQAQEIQQPTRADIISYRDHLTGKGYAANTITGYLRSVKQFFSWTAANGIYPNIAETIRTPKVDHSSHKKDALQAQEVLTIEQSIEDKARAKTAAATNANKDKAGKVQRSTEQGARLKAIYLLAVNAGLRTIEIHRANVGDLETRNGQTWLYVWGKGRSEPDQKKALAPEVAAAVKEYLATRSYYIASDPLFTATGNRSGGQRLATTTISTMLKRAMQEAGFDSPRLTAHSLRHTAGTACMEITGDLYQTQRFMRHSSPTTTEIYIHDGAAAQQQEADTAQRLYDFYHQQEASSRAAWSGI